ncbi:uncharacterized protein [Amphiura filiformis]|uniref:uncharacterized protein n=1 Tax=Amphiura filiformis TaxID=82378 RepID=UPI003B211F34
MNYIMNPVVEILLNRLNKLESKITDLEDRLSHQRCKCSSQPVRIPKPPPCAPPKQSETKEEIIEKNILGTVKWFNVKKCYGFITRKDTNCDVFVHKSGITKANPTHLKASLHDNELVIFDIVNVAGRTPEAVNVAGPDCKHVIGSQHASKKPYRFYCQAQVQPSNSLGTVTETHVSPSKQTELKSSHPVVTAQKTQINPTCTYGPSPCNAISEEEATATSSSRIAQQPVRSHHSFVDMDRHDRTVYNNHHVDSVVPDIWKKFTCLF